MLIIASSKEGQFNSLWWTLPVFNFIISLDKVCPTRSYCRRLIDSFGHSTEAVSPFLQVKIISLLVYASKIEMHLAKC